MSESTAQAKEKRKYALGKLTRVRRRAQILVDAKCSKAELLRVMSELDDAFSNLQVTSDQYIETLGDMEAVKKANDYVAEAECHYHHIMDQIEKALVEKKDDAESVASGSQCSSVKSHISDTKKSEITLKMKELELQQLKRRHERKRKEEDLRRANELEDAREAQAAAELEARLMVAAENDLQWDRRDDFIENSVVGLGGDLNRQGTELPHSAGSVHSPASAGRHRATTTVATVAPNNHASADSGLYRNLPRLELTKFSGTPGEWPRWFALFQTLVGNQPSLTETEKMAHLQGAAIGPAKKRLLECFTMGALITQQWQRSKTGTEDKRTLCIPTWQLFLLVQHRAT